MRQELIRSSEEWASLRVKHVPSMRKIQHLGCLVAEARSDLPFACRDMRSGRGREASAHCIAKLAFLSIRPRYGDWSVVNNLVVQLAPRSPPKSPVTGILREQSESIDMLENEQRLLAGAKLWNSCNSSFDWHWFA